MTVTLPFGPLEAHAVAYLTPRGHHQTRGVNRTTHAIADLLQVDRHTIYRWRHNGLTINQADTLAIRLGHHPTTIWGDQWWADIEPMVDDDTYDFTIVWNARRPGYMRHRLTCARTAATRLRTATNIEAAA